MPDKFHRFKSPILTDRPHRLQPPPATPQPTELAHAVRTSPAHPPATDSGLGVIIDSLEPLSQEHQTRAANPSPLPINSPALVSRRQPFASSVAGAGDSGAADVGGTPCSCPGFDPDAPGAGFPGDPGPPSSGQAGVDPSTDPSSNTQNNDDATTTPGTSGSSDASDGLGNVYLAAGGPNANSDSATGAADSSAPATSDGANAASGSPNSGGDPSSRTAALNSASRVASPPDRGNGTGDHNSESDCTASGANINAAVDGGASSTGSDPNSGAVDAAPRAVPGAGTDTANTADNGVNSHENVDFVVANAHRADSGNTNYKWRI
ncbi:uncharacterized protein FIBRA_03177 [Fibroporia radiculosa]|uniref:Uncharacterized protein n=1 Tax=Fibroporia radiculosa TaxID=599839 RepID=J4H294_9APHY|nr:uncharacterized protein FIBRA_03177 [Fibroporia radiculosa]CCM01129.1 predicted protein [Fibroporia radiculosa]